MTNAFAAWSIEFEAGQATLTHDRGRIVERLKLTPDFAAAVAKIGPDELTPGVLAALWAQAEKAPADMIAERQVQLITVH